MNDVEPFSVEEFRRRIASLQEDARVFAATVKDAREFAEMLHERGFEDLSNELHRTLDEQEAKVSAAIAFVRAAEELTDQGGTE